MRKILAILVLVASAPCCGGPRLTVDADYEPTTDFAKYKTWSWMDGAKPSEKDIDSLSQQRIKDAIEAELPKHGLSKADAGGDLSANYQISVQHKIKQSNATVGVGYGWGPAHIGVSKSPTSEYDEGTLIFDLVDPKTKTLIWRGTAKGTVHPENSPEEKKENIRKAIAFLLEDYPPQKQK
jgi:hypothetical protein